jgi:hypothetical protein
MSIESITNFFMWCSILNLAILFVSSLILWLCRDWIYQLHSCWFSITRETFDIASYTYIGAFKLLVIIFNVVPYFALVITN